MIDGEQQRLLVKSCGDAALGLALGIFTAPIVFLAWPFFLAWYVFNESEGYEV